MAHVRKQIRDQVASVLSASVSLVSGRVYASRVYPLTDAALPAVTVYTGAESSALVTMGTITLQRDLSITVDAYVKSTTTFDDDVDALCVQIEDAIGADFRVNGLAKDIVLSSTEIDFSSEAEQPVGVARLTFTVRYVTSISDSSTAR